MGNIIYSPELLTQLNIIRYATCQFTKIEEDKSCEQLIEEVQIIKDLLDDALSLVKHERG